MKKNIKHAEFFGIPVTKTSKSVWMVTAHCYIHNNAPFHSEKSWWVNYKILKSWLVKILEWNFVSQNIYHLKFIAFLNAWKKSPPFDGFSAFPFQLWWSSIKIGQESHQLFVGVEVVRPGEIIARKDVLHQRGRLTAYSFRCANGFGAKNYPPPKKCGSQKDFTHLRSVEHLYPYKYTRQKTWTPHKSYSFF